MSKDLLEEIDEKEPHLQRDDVGSLHQGLRHDGAHVVVNVVKLLEEEKLTLSYKYW